MKHCAVKLIDDMHLSTEERQVAGSVALSLLDAALEVAKHLPPGVGLIAILAGYGAATKSIQDVIWRVDEEFKDA